MKVLYNLQLSFLDTNKRFLLSNDSNFSFFDVLAKAFEKYYSDVRFVTLIPRFRTDYTRRDNTTYIEAPGIVITDRVFSSRYIWNPEYMSQVLKQYKPDLIWENNPTLVNNWKTLLYEEKLDIPVIAYNHWIDTPALPKMPATCPYYFRQCEGAILADKVLCNSFEAARQIIECCMHIAPNHYIKVINKIDTIAPFIDDERIVQQSYADTDKKSSVKWLMYNHRISSLPYYDTAYKRFLNSLTELDNIAEKTDTHIFVYFTDASGKLKDRSDIPFTDTKRITVKLEHLDRIQYLYKLHATDICVGSFLDGYGGAWSMSLAEGLLSNCATIIPNHSGYKEMVPSDYEFLLNDNDSISAVIKKILEMPSDKLRQAKQYGIDYYLKNYSMKALADKAYRIFGELT